MTSTRRVRVQDQRTTAGTQGSWVNNLGNTVANPTPVQTGSIRTTTDYVTSNYRKRSEAGEIIMSPYDSISVTTASESTSNQEGYTPPGPASWFKFTGDWNSHNLEWGSAGPAIVRNELIPNEDIQRLRTLASTRVLSQIGRPRTDNWENLAEMQKTVDALKAPFYSWFRYYRKLGDVGSAGLSAANLWLQMRYGLLPVMRSVVETVEQLKKRHRPERVTTRAQEAISAQVSQTRTWVHGGTYTRVYGIQKTETHRVRAMSIDEALFGKGIAFDAGFSAKGLMSLPWELLPWSFVADWFFNVGDFIGALGNYFQEKSLGQCLVLETVVSEIRQDQSVTPLPSSGYVLTSPSGGWIRRDLVWKTRSIGLESPGIVSKTDYRLDTVTRVGDMAALIGQSVIMKFVRNPDMRRGGLPYYLLGSTKEA